MKMFEGFRVQHNDARGPSGWHPVSPFRNCRYRTRPGNMDDMEMRSCRYPLGGAKGGVIVDPATLKLSEKERLCRGTYRSVALDWSAS
jgi:glutamate dehydrogenase (NAD(P)+)